MKGPCCFCGRHPSHHGRLTEGRGSYGPFLTRVVHHPDWAQHRVGNGPEHEAARTLAEAMAATGRFSEVRTKPWVLRHDGPDELLGTMVEVDVGFRRTWGMVLPLARLLRQHKLGLGWIQERFHKEIQAGRWRYWSWLPGLPMVCPEQVANPEERREYIVRLANNPTTLPIGPPSYVDPR